VRAIHESNFIHLDLKPANIFITFEGALKIGDFGLASSWPAPRGIDGEGDREYISPEVLAGNFDKPADVFALGLITLEIAGNFFLPDNGEQWLRLRSGNLADIPRLTWTEDARLVRDENGDPIEPRALTDVDCEEYEAAEDGKSDAAAPKKRREFAPPPPFMRHADHAASFENLVAWLLVPDPLGRPSIDEVCDAEGLRWVESRRRSRATVFEGSWGPGDGQAAAGMDVVMQDV
jgi:mitosis inhibitor protein kinase SWE1